MKILILGAAGFIGTNLVIELAKNENNEVFSSSISETSDNVYHDR